MMKTTFHSPVRLMLNFITLALDFNFGLILATMRNPLDFG